MPKIPLELNGAALGWPRLAVNLCDLDRVPPTIRQLLVTPKLDLAAGAIRTDRDRVDEAAVAFACPLLDAAAACDTLREHNRRAKDPPTRVYVQRRQGRVWERLPGAALLTLVSPGGQLRLNPRVFPGAGDPVQAALCKPVALLRKG